MIRYVSGLAETLLLTLGALRLAFRPVPPRGRSRTRPRRWTANSGDHGSPFGAAELADELARRVTVGRSIVSVIADLPRARPMGGPAATWTHQVSARIAGGAPLDEAVLEVPAEGDLEVVAMAILAAGGDSGAVCAGLRAAAEVIRIREDTRRRSRAASAQAVLSARVMTSLPPVVLCAAMVLSSGVRQAVASPRMVLVVLIGLALDIVGWRWMGSILSRRARDRGNRTDAVHIEDLCLLVDLIAVAVRSGAEVRATLDLLARVGPIALRPRLVRISDSLARGNRLPEALRELGPGAPETRLASTLADGLADGSALAPTLDRLAADLRSEAARLNATRLAELPVRLTPPLVVCTLPSVALIAVAPVALAALGSIRADL